MEAISPEIVTTSASSPLGQFRTITISPLYQQILPPIKHLPTWNRSKLRFTKTTKHLIQKNNSIIKEELEPEYCSHFEQGTQTSPVQPRQIQTPTTPAKTPERDLLLNTFNKRLLFLQSSHSIVLSNLQEEIEKLKQENKALQFQLVMTSGALKESSLVKDKPSNDSISAVKHELAQTKNELRKAKDLNEQLNNMVQQNPKHSCTFPSEMVKKTTKEEIDNSNERNLGLLKFVPQSSMKGKMDSSTPSKDVQNNLTNEENDEVHNAKKNNFLPKLSVSQKKRSANKNHKSQSRVPKEPTTFPVLQPFPGNQSIRPKRSQTFNTKKQRTNIR